MNSIENPFDYLEAYGTSLVEHGSAERALGRDAAIDFVRMLQAQEKYPLGIEVWRKVGERWKIDSLGGWFVDDLTPEDAAIDAIRFLCRSELMEDVIFTVQF